MTDTTQAVAGETDAAAQTQATEANSAPDDLDTLLKEFESPTDQKPREAPAPTQETPKPGNDSRLDEIYNYIQHEQTSRARDEFKRDFSETVKAVKGDLDTSDTLAEGFIHAMAQKDQRISQAFVNRARNPETWKKIQGELHKSFVKEFDKQPDKRLTEDREAVAAAVRSATNQPPQEQQLDGAKLGQMSDSEFRRFEKQFRD